MTWEEFMEGFYARHPGLKGQVVASEVSEAGKAPSVRQDPPPSVPVEVPRDYKVAASEGDWDGIEEEVSDGPNEQG